MILNYQKINHEETKSAKISFVPPPRSSRFPVDMEIPILGLMGPGNAHSRLAAALTSLIKHTESRALAI
jgi:hypothetical protein